MICRIATTSRKSLGPHSANSQRGRGLSGDAPRVLVSTCSASSSIATSYPSRNSLSSTPFSPHLPPSHLAAHRLRASPTRSSHFMLLSQLTEGPNHALQRTAPRVTVAAILACARLVRSWLYPTSVASFCAPPSQLPRHAPPSLSLGSLGAIQRFHRKPNPTTHD